jgi:hypothetical protein
MNPPRLARLTLRRRKGGNLLGKDPSSPTVKHRPVDRAAHEAFSAPLRELPPERR